MSATTKIKDCIKGFNSGIKKVIPPVETYELALKKIRNMRHQILYSIIKVKRPSNIPQYRFIAADYFDETTPGLGSNGKGHTREQALASGIMELVERYSCFKYINSKKTYKIASFNTIRLNNNSFSKEDFLLCYAENIPDKSRLNKDVMDARIRWYKAYTLSGESLFLPAALCVKILHRANGMAAGNSLEEALLHGIFEIIERHCMTMIFQNKISVPHIDISSISDPISESLLVKFNKLNQKIVIMDFSLNMGIPVIGMMRFMDDTYCLITIGVATSKYEALIKALTENSQAEHDTERCLISDVSERYLISDVRYLLNQAQSIGMENIPQIENKNIKIELETIEKILNNHNMKVFFHDTTDKEIQIPSVIAFVTGAKLSNEKLFRNLLCGIIEEYIETERYNEAKDYVDKFQDIDEKNQPIYEYYKGIIYQCQNEYKKAITYFESILSEINNNTHKLFNYAYLGICYQAIGEKAKAIDCYSKSIDISPKFQIQQLNIYNSIMKSNNDTLKQILNDAKVLYNDVLCKKNPTIYIYPHGSADDIVTSSEVIDYLKITNKFYTASRDLLKRQITKAEAQNRGLSVTDKELQQASDTFRTFYNLRSADETEEWLKTNNISINVYEEYLETNILISKLKDSLEKQADIQEYAHAETIEESIREMIYQDWLNGQLK